MKISLIIPAYNEENRIEATLRAVDAYFAARDDKYEIIVVNDGSSDKTIEIAKKHAAESDAIRIVNYEKNFGKGYAVRQGVFVARGDYIAFSDADLSAPIEELPKLFDAIKDGYDIAIGSRAIDRSLLGTQQPWYRQIGGRGINLIIRMLAVPGIKDTQCGFKLFRGNVAREIFSRCFLNGWGFDVEALYLARRLGYTVAEVPVRWSHSEGSKIHPFSAGIGVVENLLQMRVHRYDIRK